MFLYIQIGVPEIQVMLALVYQNLTDGQIDGLIESTTTLCRDRKIRPSVKDLQSTTRLAELHICDTRWINLSLYKVMIDYFSRIPLNSCKNPLILFTLKIMQNVYDQITAPTHQCVIVKVMM